MTTLNAYDYDSYISILSSSSSLSPYKLDNKSESLLLNLAHITDKIKPVDSDGRRRNFYVCLPSPSLDYYTQKQREGLSEREYKEYYVDDKHIKKTFAESYPAPEKWYSVSIIHEAANGHYPEFIAVFVNNEYILSYNDINAKGEAMDETEFIEDLINQAQTVLDKLADGTYNSFVSNNLPDRMRYGTISRKDYYDIYPDTREKLHEDLNQQDMKELAEALGKDDDVPANAYETMTARKYFEAAAIGISSVQYAHKRNQWLFKNETQEEIERYKGTRFDGTTPRLIYMGSADGRDDGLTNIPLDDSEAFEEWDRKQGPYYTFNGSHPWEIRTSMSISLSIHLYPYQDPKSKLWYFILTGSAYSTCNETVHYYLAMKRAGIPVVLDNSKHIIDRFLETDNIGIVPETISTFLTTYIPDTFDGKNVGDIVNLPDKKTECKKVLKKVHWLAIPEVQLQA